ncbi:MAG: hypothetical protein IPP40_11535 [bacterium]|nr:hypothetical protein [bacterium]
MLAPYIAAKTFLRLFALVSQAMNFLLYPMAARLAAEGDLPKLASKLKIALAGVWAVGIPAALALWFYADPVIPTLRTKIRDCYAFVVALLPAARPNHVPRLRAFLSDWVSRGLRFRGLSRLSF